MRAIVVYTLAILAGAIGYSFASRAERWVGAGTAAAGGTTPAGGDVTGLRLEVYAIGAAAPERVVTVNADQLDIGELATKMDEAAWRAVQQAVARLPIATDRRPAPPERGGDLLAIERGSATTYVQTSGWEAGPVDAVKEAVWNAVRTRWAPARKRRPSTEFVEPYQKLRTQLRIKF